MHTQESLLHQLHQLGIDGQGTLLMHSSMKSMGEVEGGADTVLDALTEYMKDGLLVLPTHTWSTINADNPMFHVESSPCCVGILPELSQTAGCGPFMAPYTLGSSPWTRCRSVHEG